MIHLDLMLEVRNSCGFLKSCSYDIVCMQLSLNEGGVSVVMVVHRCPEPTEGRSKTLVCFTEQ